MSAHDYVRRSSYVEDAYPDHVEGKGSPIISYSSGLGTYATVTKIEYDEGIHRSGRRVYPFTRYEPHEFFTKIFDEVNGPPHRTNDPCLGGFQYRVYSYPGKAKRVDVYEPNHRYGASPVKVDPTSSTSSRASDPNPRRGPYSCPVKPATLGNYEDDPNLGRDRYSCPVKPGTLGNYQDDRGYTSYTAKVDTTRDYGYDYNYGSSPVKSRPPNHQLSRSSSHIYDHPLPGDYGAPNHQWGGYGVNSEAPGSPGPKYDHPPDRSYPIPNSQWGNPPLKSHDYGDPDNPSPTKPNPLKSQTTWVYEAPDNPSPRKPSSPGGQEVRKNGWGASPLKPQTPYEYGVPPDDDDLSAVKPENLRGHIENQWGRPPLSIDTGDYGVPSNEWDKSSSPTYGHPRDKSEKQGEGPARKTQTVVKYGVPQNKWDRSSIPNDHPRSNPSGTESQWRLAPVKTGSPEDYGVPRNQQGRSSSPIHGYPQNNPSGPKNEWASSPVKTDSPRGYRIPSNQWDRSLSPVDYQQPNDGHYKPPQVTCKDGVCTFNDKPKGPQRTPDEPAGNRNSFPVNEPDSYSDHDQYGREGWRSNPYNPNQTKRSGYDMGEQLEQLNLDPRASPKGGAAAPTSRSSAPIGFSGPQKFSIAPRVGPRQENKVGAGDIDNRKAEKRYAGYNIPGKPNAGGEDQKKIITSKEALEKYNGSTVPKY